MPDSQRQVRPLTGLKVVECSTWAFGPLCGVMLGDLGADVVKVENPNQPDAARTLLVIAGADMEMPDGKSALFDIVNRNKRSVAIDLKTDRGRHLLKELIADADIFLQNFRPGVFDRMGLGYEDLAREQPRLIYACTSGYGLRGDETERPALDPVGQARAGMFYASGEPGDPPNWISFGFADIMGASMLAYGVVAAVVALERHGCGQLVEASHLQACMWLEYWGIGAGLYKGLTDWPRFDRKTAANPLFNHYQAADGEWLTVGLVDSTRHWDVFCQALDLHALVHDPRFADAERRRQNAAALVALLDRPLCRSATRHLGGTAGGASGPRLRPRPAHWRPPHRPRRRRQRLPHRRAPSPLRQRLHDPPPGEPLRHAGNRAPHGARSRPAHCRGPQGAAR